MRIDPAAYLVGALVAAGFVMPAHAQDARRTKMMLSDVATRQVEQDLLVAQLRARVESETGEEARELVDAAIHAATDTVTTFSGIRHLEKGGYRVFQGRDGDGRAAGWIAEQDLILRARESLPLLQLVERLQADGLELIALAYELSRDGRRAAETELAAESIEVLKARGDEIAAKMGMQVGRITTVRVTGTSDAPSDPLDAQAAAPAAESALPPVVLPGRETVGVTVDAELRLIRQ